MLVGYYDPDQGHLTSANECDRSMIPDGQEFVELPADFDLADLGAWKVDLETKVLIRIGREPERGEINAERDRRIAAGFPFAGKVIQFRPEDKQRITGAGALAGFAIGQGKQPGDFYWADPDEKMEWITADNSVLSLDAQTTFAMAQAAAKHEKRHIFAAAAIKDASPRPEDFKDDKHWPEGAA